MSEEEVIALFEQYNAKLQELYDSMIALKAELDAIKPAEEAVEASDEEKPEEDIEASDAPAEDEEEKLDALAAKLSDRIFKNLQGMRLGDRPNAPAPSGKRPVTPIDKLAAAKQKGLSGMDALKASFK